MFDLTIFLPKGKVPWKSKEVFSKERSKPRQADLSFKIQTGYKTEARILRILQLLTYTPTYFDEFWLIKVFNYLQSTFVTDVVKTQPNYQTQTQNFP